MTEISKKFEQLIQKTYKEFYDKEQIVPAKIGEGILVGVILIKNQNSLKNLYRGNECIYKEIFLNVAAIKIANILNKFKSSSRADQIYKLDQNYGRYFIDSQMLRNNYEKALNNRDYNKADILYARYIESRDRAIIFKNQLENLIKQE
jgi:hypothetical protein